MQLFSTLKRVQLKVWKRFLRTHGMVKQKEKMPTAGYVMLVFPVSAFCLGVWQVKRRAWKMSLIEALEKKILEPPVDLPDNIEEIEGMEYRTVHVIGHFDHSREMYVRPRTLISNDGERKGIMSSIPKTGALVVTPFILSDRDWTILVNRGWVSKNKIQPETRPGGQITGEIQLAGLVRLEEKRMPFDTKNPFCSKDSNRHWLRRDIARMSQVAQTQPIFIDADSGSTVPGGPIGGQTRVTLRNEHLSYIITWFSLSAATSYLWFQRYAKAIF